MKYRVHVTGMVESSEWYEVEADSEDEAADLALEEADADGFDDPMVTVKPRTTHQDGGGNK